MYGGLLLLVSTGKILNPFQVKFQTKFIPFGVPEKKIWDWLKQFLCSLIFSYDSFITAGSLSLNL